MQATSRFCSIAAAAALLALLLGAWAQQDPRQLWAVLGRVTFNGGNDVLSMNMVPPTYSREVLALEGKTITIEGYVIPMDFGGGYIVISSNPYATCFFCGGAGPETVMEVYLKEKKKIDVEKVTVRGKLVLNRGEIEHLTYMLQEAEIVP
jgi:hypothetical protein